MEKVYCTARLSALGVLIGLSLFSLQLIAEPNKKLYMFDIRSQSLQKALLDYSKQTGVVIAASADILRGKTTRGIFGYLTIDEAINKLLENSSLEYFISRGNVIHILATKSATETKRDIVDRNRSIKHDKTIENVTVTGSHIKGLTNSPAPVIQISREEIKRSGAKTISEYLHKLPQFFASGALENAGGEITGKNRQWNIANANAISLYGTGYDSTLVLLNGHRMTTVGEGDIVDLSRISINIIERIDILADGASAIYGTDAIGGVVNIILRRDYTGNETHIGYSNVTSGNFEEYRLSHVFGHQWESGGAIVSYGYYDRSNLSTENRSATEDATDPSDILGKYFRDEILISVSQQMLTAWDIYADGFYSSRRSETLQLFAGDDPDNTFPSHWPIFVDQYQVVLGSKIQLTNHWEIDTSMLYSSSETSRDVLLLDFDLFASQVSIKNSLREFKSIVNGNAFDTWGGTARFAVGIEYRSEQFDPSGHWLYFFNNDFFPIAFTFNGEPKVRERSISAFFQEINIPIINDDNTFDQSKKLEMTLAGRYDKYDDIEDIFNPKLGLLWSPGWGVSIHSAWSQSFRAPQLRELNCAILCNHGETTVSVESIKVSRYNDDRIPTIIVADFPDLKSETAEQWTLNIDYSPTFITSLNINLEYFDIDYYNRIEMILDNLERNRVQYALDNELLSVAQLNPNINLVKYYMSLPGFNNSSDIEPGEIKALISLGQRNISYIKQRGLNFSFYYTPEIFSNDFTVRVDGTYLFELQKRIYKYTPAIDEYNKPYRPVDFKLRSSVSWEKNNLLSNVAVNYVNSYLDKRTRQVQNISSWTTVDVNFQYKLRLHSNLDDTSILLSISNLFDRSPPFVRNHVSYNYDATNANATGRRISVEFSQSW